MDTGGQYIDFTTSILEGLGIVKFILKLIDLNIFNFV